MCQDRSSKGILFAFAALGFFGDRGQDRDVGLRNNIAMESMNSEWYLENGRIDTVVASLTLGAYGLFATLRYVKVLRGMNFVFFLNSSQLASKNAGSLACSPKIQRASLWSQWHNWRWCEPPSGCEKGDEVNKVQEELADIGTYDIYIYIWASIARHPPPPPTPWLWVCIVAPQYPSPPVVWVVWVVVGGGGGRSCICMYMNVYVWCECMFLVFVYDYDMICI